MTQFLTSLFAKTIMHATYFKTANQQHQQNPVNELSCTNLYALVCFLRTNICGSFLWYTVYIEKHTYTHTRLTALFPGLPGQAGTRKVNQSGFY